MIYEDSSRASVIIELIEDADQYEAVVVSTNGTILQPYDTSTTLIGTVLKNKLDITNKIKDIKWTKWNPTSDNLIECPEWNSKHIGMSTIEIKKDDVDSKSVFTFEARNDSGELLCSSSISIIDINDLLVSTAEPANPYVGQLWVDDSSEPATIYVWNGFKWVIAGSVGAIVKNLLRNTSFIYNADYWDIVGDTRLSYTPYGVDHLSHRFLKMASNVVTGENRGVSQTTNDIICTNSEYSFQMLFYSLENTQTYSNNITVNIYSINNKKEKTLITTKIVEAVKDMKRLFTTFNTLSDTKDIQVEILGEANHRYNFYIGELALYNTWNDYPWTVNPLDFRIEGAQFTQEELWNILSNNGTVQGIFTRTNPETGQLDYYINASMIGAGKVKARYIEMYGLKVRNREDGRITLEITENGDVNLDVNSLVLSCGKTVEDYINDVYIDISNNGLFIKVDSNGKQSLVDVTGEEVFIESNSIKLEGYTTINNGFSIDLDGNMTANNGNFNGTITSSNIISPEIISDETDSPKFKLDKDGKLTAQDAYIKGTIESSEIIGSTIKTTNLIAPSIVSDETENPKFSLSSDGTLKAINAEIAGQISGTILTGNVFMSENKKFVVTENGTLDCQEANIKGTIQAGSMISETDITGGRIIGTVIQNAEKDPTFTVSAEGIVTGAQIKGGTIGIGGDDYSAFIVDEYGNCNISKGTIKIGDNFLVNNDGSFTANSANITGNIQSGSTITGSVIKGGSIDIGNGTFTVDNEGNLVAKSAIIDAEISATTGYVAGFKVSDNKLTATNVGISSSSDDNAVAFWAGSDTIQSAPYRVYNNGKVEASNVDISGGVLNIGNGNFVVTNTGELTAKSGSFHGDITAGSTITGSTIQNTSGTFKVDADGNITGASISGGSVTGTTVNGGTLTIGDNFKVIESGALTAKSADITGKLTCEEGTIGGFTIGKNTLTNGTVGMASNSEGNIYAFWAGNSDSSLAPFRVKHDGSLYANSVNISGGSIGSNTQIDGNCVIDGTVTAKKLVIADFTNLIIVDPNSTFEGVSGAQIEGYTVSNIENNTALQHETITNRFTNLIGKERFRVFGYVKNSDTTISSVKLAIQGCWRNSNNNILSSDTVAITTNEDKTWLKFSVELEVSDRPTGASHYSIKTFLYDSTVGRVFIDSFGIYRMANGELIIDGSITAEKISGKELIGVTLRNESNTFSVDGNGNIKGSSITGSSFSGYNDWFKVEDDGSVVAKDINAEEINAVQLKCDYISVPWYSRSLTRNITVYIDPTYIYPDEDNIVFENESKFKSFADLKGYAPRNLNGYTIDIYLDGDITENILLNNFNGGKARISMRGYSIKGYISCYGRSMDYEIYGNKPGYTKTTTRGTVVPGSNGKLQSDYRYCIVGDRCRLTVYDIDCYAGTGTDYNDGGICCTNGCIAYLSAIKAVNEPYLLVRCHSASHVYVESSSGRSNNSTFHSVSGSILHLNDTTQAGTSGSNGTTYKNNNGQIFADGVTYDNTSSTGTVTAPSTNTTTTITKTIKSDTGRSWRTSGSYANSWSSDVIVRQGRWATSYGTNVGYWFFGSDIYNILQDGNNTVTSIKIKITRNSGGQNASVTHYLRAHTYASKPSSPSLLNTGVLNKSFGLAVGNSITISLSSSEINALKSNKAKGFGIYTSSTAQSGYSCCSASATVTITYKTTSND